MMSSERHPSVEEEAGAWLLRLATTEVSADDLAAFRAWRDADPRHESAFDEARALWNDVDVLESRFAAVPEATIADPRRRRAGRSATVARRRRLLFPVAMAAAIGLLLVAAAVTDLPTRLAADHWTAVGEQARVTLPDGSLAHLNTDTAIAVAFAPAQRRVVLLHGEALFEVEPDPRRPFTVAALDGRSTALGTAFVVGGWDGVATVTVAEGTVRVEAPAAPEDIAPARGASVVTLGAGDRVRYAAGGAPGPIDHVDPHRAADWRHGAVHIHDLPFGDAVAEIDRYRPGSILLLADPARLDRVTATLALASLDEGVDALAATHGLSVLRVTPYLTLIR